MIFISSSGRTPAGLNASPAAAGSCPASAAALAQGLCAQTAPPPSLPPSPPLPGAANYLPPISSGYDQAVTRLPDFIVEGRQDDLIGVADSATQGTVAAKSWPTGRCCAPARSSKPCRA